MKYTHDEAQHIIKNMFATFDAQCFSFTTFAHSSHVCACYVIICLKPLIHALIFPNY
jgi:hypothetical protein